MSESFGDFRAFLSSYIRYKSYFCAIISLNYVQIKCNFFLLVGCSVMLLWDFLRIEHIKIFRYDVRTEMIVDILLDLCRMSDPIKSSDTIVGKI